MAEPFLSEIRIFSFNYPPKGWAFCNGQLLSIAQNTALFSLIGTYYGGNGQTTFQLPNLQGRAPLHSGPINSAVGTQGGEAAHTLTLGEIPTHFHTLQGQNVTATTGSPSSANLAQPVSNVGAVYATTAGDTTMAPQAIANAGNSQPHNNMQPYLTLNFCIALVGIFPSRN
ncbi:tail Collar domain-containing protein [Capsulimonas corticalis]|uniref:Tail Collar domain-containing protein n=1 Tax=Capsulimonas corticalis TaxID=2219043 RepID=A0A402D0J3_9BACT|nr:tail fiber protein [Capsulimonas corticalis]BDI33580.1 tail Collar domain-containing protein [Capsulimonas corticalis]